MSTKLDLMLEEATRTLGPGPLLAFARQALRQRRSAQRLGRRAPAPLAWVAQLDEIKRRTGIDYTNYGSNDPRSTRA